MPFMAGSSRQMPDGSLSFWSPAAVWIVLPHPGLKMVLTVCPLGSPSLGLAWTVRSPCFLGGGRWQVAGAGRGAGGHQAKPDSTQQLRTWGRWPLSAVSRKVQGRLLIEAGSGFVDSFLGVHRDFAKRKPCWLCCGRKRGPTASPAAATWRLVGVAVPAPCELPVQRLFGHLGFQGHIVCLQGCALHQPEALSMGHPAGSGLVCVCVCAREAEGPGKQHFQCLRWEVMLLPKCGRPNLVYRLACAV